MLPAQDGTEDVRDAAGLLPVLVAICFSSTAASAWMMRECSNGPPRLLKRQLFHQALTTLLFNVGSIMNYTFLIPKHSGNYCIGDEDGTDEYVVRVLQHGLFFATCLVELYIAASAAAAACHSPWALGLLGRCLCSVWPLGAVYAAQAAAMASLRPKGFAHVSTYDPIGSLLVLCCFYLTFIFQLTALFRAWRAKSPNVVLKRMQRRAMVFPFVFILSGFPTCLRYLRLFEVCSFLGVLSGAGEHAIGLLNAVAFCLLKVAPTRGVPAADTTESARTFQTFHTFQRTESGRAADIELAQREARSARVVGFKTAVEEQEVDMDSSWRYANQWKDRHSSLDEELSQERAEGGANRLSVASGVSSATDALACPRTTVRRTLSETLWDEYVGTEEY